MIGVDHLGPFQRSHQGNSYVLVAVDYLTRWLVTVPVPDTSTTPVLRALEQEVLCRFGACERLISDRGSAFTSQQFAEAMRKWSIRHTLATTERPQTNGLCERANRTLVDVLRCYIGEDQGSWETLLARVTFSINTAKSETTQLTPFELLYGRSPVHEFDLAFPWPEEIPEKVTASWQKVRRWRKIAQRLTRLCQQKSSRLLNPKRRPLLDLVPGQLVLVKRRGRVVGRTTKLLQRFTGPYQVVKRLCPTTYLVEDIPARRRRRRWRRFNAHVTQLRLFHTRAEVEKESEPSPGESDAGQREEVDVQTDRGCYAD